MRSEKRRARRAASPPAPVLVVASIASVQVGAAMAEHLFPVLGTTGTVAVRLATAAGLLLAVARPRLRTVGRAHLRLVVGFGVVLAVMNLSFYGAIARIPLGIAVTVEFLGPLVLAAVGVRRARDLAWPGLAVAGVLLLTGGGSALSNGSLDPWGVALALVAAAGWAAYITASQRVGAVLPRLDGLALALLVAALLVAPAGIATAGRALLRADVLAVGIGVGVLSSALPWALELVALRTMTTVTFGVAMSLEPAMAALAGLALLHQGLTGVQALAITITCVASAGAAWTARGSAAGPTGPAVSADRQAPASSPSAGAGG